MKNLFPHEIVNFTIENHFYKFNRFTHNIYLFTILFTTGAACSLFYIKTKISVQCSGLIRSMSEPVDLISPIVAEVKSINIAENKFVSKGDTLLWLNNQKLAERNEHLNSLIAQNNDYLSDLFQMLDIRYASLKTELYKSVYAQYNQKLADHNLQIEILRKTFDRTQLLFEKKVVPLAEKEEQEFNLEKSIESKSIFIQQSRSDWQKLTAEYKLANDKYQNEIDGLLRDFENYFILSPCVGHITNFSGIKPGSYVTTGQRIAVISPEDELVSEHLVPPKDIGFLEKAMPVVFQVDAYNYNQWGLASGVITDISNEVYILNSQPYFRVRCSLNEQFLSLKNGYKGYLKKGLTTNASFQVTERTLAQLLFDKADNWLNPNLNE
jgi:multidrug resistance efflux pump